MTAAPEPPVYRCWNCNKRLPIVDAGNGVVVWCKHCRKNTRIEVPPKSFRASVAIKA